MSSGNEEGRDRSLEVSTAAVRLRAQACTLRCMYRCANLLGFWTKVKRKS